MGKTAFSSFMDRSRIDRLEHEIALIALDLLKTYINEPEEKHVPAYEAHPVSEGFMRAGRTIHYRQLWGAFGGFNDLILTEGQRLLQLARPDDSAATDTLGPIAQEIAAAPDKVRAGADEIETEITALCTRFEDQGYRPCEIGRALIRVGLTFAPLSFIETKVWLYERDQIGRAERERAFLDGKLGGDRYGKNKGTRH